HDHCVPIGGDDGGRHLGGERWARDREYLSLHDAFWRPTSGSVTIPPIAGRSGRPGSPCKHSRQPPTVGRAGSAYSLVQLAGRFPQKYVAKARVWLDVSSELSGSFGVDKSLQRRDASPRLSRYWCRRRGCVRVRLVSTCTTLWHWRRRHGCLKRRELFSRPWPCSRR